MYSKDKEKLSAAAGIGGTSTFIASLFFSSCGFMMADTGIWPSLNPWLQGFVFSCICTTTFLLVVAAINLRLYLKERRQQKLEELAERAKPLPPEKRFLSAVHPDLVLKTPADELHDAMAETDPTAEPPAAKPVLAAELDESEQQSAEELIEVVEYDLAAEIRSATDRIMAQDHSNNIFSKVNTGMGWPLAHGEIHAKACLILQYKYSPQQDNYPATLIKDAQDQLQAFDNILAVPEADLLPLVKQFIQAKFAYNHSLSLLLNQAILVLNFDLIKTIFNEYQKDPLNQYGFKAPFKAQDLSNGSQIITHLIVNSREDILEFLLKNVYGRDFNIAKQLDWLQLNEIQLGTLDLLVHKLYSSLNFHDNNASIFQHIMLSPQAKIIITKLFNMIPMHQSHIKENLYKELLLAYKRIVLKQVTINNYDQDQLNHISSVVKILGPKDEILRRISIAMNCQYGRTTADFANPALSRDVFRGLVKTLVNETQVQDDSEQDLALRQDLVREVVKGIISGNWYQNLIPFLLLSPDYSQTTAEQVMVEAAKEAYPRRFPELITNLRSRWARLWRYTEQRLAPLIRNLLNTRKEYTDANSITQILSNDARLRIAYELKPRDVWQEEWDVIFNYAVKPLFGVRRPEAPNPLLEPELLITGKPADAKQAKRRA